MQKESILIKKGHTYIFRWQEEDSEVLLQTLIEKASDPMCPIDWFDAAVVSHSMNSTRLCLEFQKMIKNKLG